MEKPRIKVVLNTAVILIFILLAIATFDFFFSQLPDSYPSNTSVTEKAIPLAYTFLLSVMTVIAEADLCLTVLYFASSKERHNRYKTIINVICAIISLCVLSRAVLDFLGDFDLILLALLIMLRLLYLVAHIASKIIKRDAA